MASRTGTPGDAWAIDHQAHVNALEAAQKAGVALRAALRDLRAKAAAGVSAGQAGLRGGADRFRPDLFDRAADGLLQVAVGPDRAGAARQTLPGLRRRHADRLQADQRRRPWRLPRRLPGGRRAAGTACCRSAARARRSRRASRAKPVCAAGTPAPISVRAGRAARRHRRRARRARAASRRSFGEAELARIGRYTPPNPCWCWTRKRADYDAAGTPSTGTQTLFDFYRRCWPAPRPSAAITRCSETAARLAGCRRTECRVDQLSENFSKPSLLNSSRARRSSRPACATAPPPSC